MRYKQLRELEQRAMTGIGVDNQLRSRYSLRQIEGIHGGNHDVMISIYDQRRLADVIGLRIAFAVRFAPGDDGRALGGHCLRRIYAPA